MRASRRPLARVLTDADAIGRMSVSRDGRSIIYDRLKAILDLIMIETFGETIGSISGGDCRSGPVGAPRGVPAGAAATGRRMED